MLNRRSVPSFATAQTGSAASTIARLVARTERLEILGPLAIMAFFIGMPLVTTLRNGHPILALLNTLLLGLIGTVVVRIVGLLVLAPLRAIRYRNAARALDAMLAGRASADAVRHRWSASAPGAIAVERSGRVLLIDRTTDYVVTQLQHDQIAGVDIVADTKVRTIERHRSGFVLAVPLGGLITGLTLPGRSTLIIRIAEHHGLALRFQARTNGSVVTSLIPFGGDRDGAASLKVLLDRL